MHVEAELSVLITDTKEHCRVTIALSTLLGWRSLKLDARKRKTHAAILPEAPEMAAEMAPYGVLWIRRMITNTIGFRIVPHSTRVIAPCREHCIGPLGQTEGAIIHCRITLHGSISLPQGQTRPQHQEHLRQIAMFFYEAICKRIMKAIVIFACGFFFLFTSGNANSQDLDSLLEHQVQQNMLSNIPCKDVDMLSVVENLRNTLGLPICFEEVLSDRSKDELTNQQAVIDLKSVEQKRPLSKDEKTKLQWYETSVNSGHVEVVGVKRRRFSFDPDVSSLRSFLNSLTEASDEYNWAFSNGKLVISPKKSSLGWTTSIRIKERISLNDALSAFRDQLKSKRIGFADIVTGAGVVGMSEMLVGPVDLQELAFSDILTRLTDSVGPQTYWVMAGYTDMSFINIRQTPGSK